MRFDIKRLTLDSKRNDRYWKLLERICKDLQKENYISLWEADDETNKIKKTELIEQM